MNTVGVYIVMATYNGQQWLPEQLKSIQGQTRQNWTLLVSDDGSVDGTIPLLKQAALDDQRIRLLPPRGGAAGHVANFEYLLERGRASGAEFIFLSDQDDFWESQKLDALLSGAIAFPGGARAIFSDLELVTAEGARRGSFLKNLIPNRVFDLAELLRQNYLTGCSMGVSTKLLELALPFPDDLQNHDWWLGLCAASLASLEFCPDKLVRYRQHQGNVIGAGSFATKSLSLWSVLRRQRRVFESKLIAVTELIDRLQARGLEVPAPLHAYIREFHAVEGWAPMFSLLSSEFKPRSRALYLLQLLALSPIFGHRQ